MGDFGEIVKFGWVKIIKEGLFFLGVCCICVEFWVG